MVRTVIYIAIGLGSCAAASAELRLIAPGAPQPGQVMLQPVPAEGLEIVTTAGDTFTVKSTPEMRAHINGEEGSVFISPAAGQKFGMYLQFKADPAEGGQLVTQEQMHEAITKLAERFIKDSQEGKPQFKSIKYAGRQGFYTVFTDKRLVGVEQPKDNDYRYAVVGMLRLSEASILQFTLLTNDLASPDFFRPLTYAMNFAKPVPTTQPVAADHR